MQRIAVRAVSVLAGALSLAAGSAAAQTAAMFPAEANGQIIFVMPSKNVGCTFTPQGGTSVYQPHDGGPELSCDRVEPQYVRVVMTPKSLVRYNNVGDRDCCGVNVFAYGTRWTQGPFVCDSAQSGLTCRRQDGRNFVLSRSGVVLK